MNTTLRVLVVEDSESDTGLILRHLGRAGYMLIHERVETEAEMRAALEREDWDIVVADYSLPQFDAFAALRLVHERGRDIPFIVVSGSIGEDTAVAIMKAGANDYVMKDNLPRLLPAVQRELGDAEVRRERRRAEEALRQSEERFRALYDDNPSMYFTMDALGTVLSVNRFGAAELGYGVEELVGQPVLTVFHPDDKEAVRKQFNLCLKHPMQVAHWEFRKVRKDGSVLWVKETARAVPRADGQPVVLVVCEDVTERKRTEEERARLATAIEQAAEGFVVTDKDWIIQYVNPALERISGYDKGEIIGRHISLLNRGETHGTFFKQLQETLSRGDVSLGRSTSRKKDGTLYEVEVAASPVRDNSGTIINYVSMLRDITLEVRLERELRQAQKMEALGTLAGGIAHDFNNILAAILGFAQMALYKSPEESPVRRDLERVLKAGSRATDLVRQILAFSRETEQKRKPLFIVPVVKEALKLLRSSLPSTIEIRQEVAIQPDEGIVLADPTQIHQVLMNLCANAAHAMRGQGGILSVNLSLVQADDFLVSSCPELKPGPYVRLTVSDTGHGIDAAVIDRIFDPYFTTKGLGEGTGLGLAVVRGIVKNHGGAVIVYSQPQLGTSFHVFLPKIEAKVAQESVALETLPTGNERILFVDDEQTLTDLGKELLESLGYKVTPMTSSVEALEAFRSNPDAFDLVITDLTMPGLTGTELAGELLAIAPDIRVILCTGFSELVNDTGAQDMGIREFVTKPYVLSSLSATIRKVLQED